MRGEAPVTKFPIDLLDDLIAIRPGDPFKPTTKIRLPDWQQALRGRVLAIGPTVKDIAVDDAVMFGAAKGMESTFDGASIRIMREDDIDGLLE